VLDLTKVGDCLTLARMNYRTLGRTGFSVSTCSFGAWAIGGSWGVVDDDTSMSALRTFVELGGNFIDTADVYGDGRSERLAAQICREFPGRVVVATKAGRRLNPHNASGYTPANIEGFVDRSLTNLASDSIDLVQLHCPPTAVYYTPELFDGLEAISKKGKVRHWGVSVEKVEEAIKAIEYDVVKTVQIIFNPLRHRPAEVFFDLAARRDVGILARLPLASGLLAGRLTRESTYANDDHRNFNRVGVVFDGGETFSGLGGHLPTAFDVVDRLKPLVEPGQSLVDLTLRWILSFPQVTCVIPGAKTADQVRANVKPSDLGPLPETSMRQVRAIYDQHVRPLVHHRW
jgi:aryl-alcohol dehydrogenase-like predicted oxidoreductase